MSRKSNGYTRIKDIRSYKGSSTPGKEKGGSCVKSGIKNLLTNDTRIYRKDPIRFNKLWLETFGGYHNMK